VISHGRLLEVRVAEKPAFTLDNEPEHAEVTATDRERRYS